MYFFGLALLVIALPLSKFLMSVSQFYLVGVFILDGIDREKVLDFFGERDRKSIILLIVPYSIAWAIEAVIRKFKRFFSSDNIPAVVFSSLYLLHILGLIHTVDFDYALKDLRIKLPILLLPLIFSTMPTLDRTQFRRLMMIFAGAVLVATLISIYFLLSEPVADIREISKFISHIRFSLLICIAIFILTYWILKQSIFNLKWKLVFLAVNTWFIAYLIIVTSITGLVILIATGIILLIVLVFQVTKSWWMKSLYLVFLVVIPITVISFVVSIVNDVYKVHPIDVDRLDKNTAQGNPYWHDLTNEQIENGYYVWLYINFDEMRKAWNERSDMDFDGPDKRGQELRYTLVRFLTSKGYRKDAEGVNKLTDEEIALVEEGEASILYHERPHLYVRLYKIIWEYQQYQLTGNASGHSVMQRFVYAQTAVSIIKEKPWFGVGTGDLNLAFHEKYKQMNTLLDEQFRWRSHNQFLAISVGFGLLGLVWFLFSLLYPPIVTQRFSDYFYLSFFLVILFSMFAEDTIETQAGVTIFAFFSSLYLFAKKFHDSF